MSQSNNQYEVLLCVYTIQDDKKYLSDLMPAAEVFQFDDRTEAIAAAEQLAKLSYPQSDDTILRIKVYSLDGRLIYSIPVWRPIKWN